jgi:NAD-dependent SIR2 family protein deacetylase
LKKENENVSANQPSLALVKRWITDAGAVLIVAGAGMSVKKGEMVYTDPDDFAAAYPWFLKWGYKTSYEVMGLGSDKYVPETAKWGLHAKHMDNMRWKYTPNEGYESLLQMVSDKNYFVLTSNVDGCFERSGFDPARIYTPQGEWTYLQCKKPCQNDSVFPSRPYLNAMLANLSSDGLVPEELVPKCPRCGSDMFGNVRGGSCWLVLASYVRSLESGTSNLDGVSS